MRIGELAKAAGVSTRTVRHYHRVGVLPEPPRTPSGYRAYGIRDLVRLSHARRLIELGLSLPEVRDVLSDDDGRELGDLLEAMDAQLAVQAERIAAQRRRLADLRSRVRDGRLGLDDLPEPELVEFFSRIAAAGATGPIARLDREILAFVPEHEARRWIGPLLRRMADERFTRRLVEMYDDFDRIAPLPPEDVRIERFVDALWDVLPAESRTALAEAGLGELAGPAVLEALFTEMTPAQVAAARLLLVRAGDEPTSRKEDR